MSTEINEIIIATIGAIASIIGAVIAGKYSVKVAKIEKTKDKLSNKNKNRGKIFTYILIILVVSPPIAFTIALFGNAITGVPMEILIKDSLDSAIVSPLLCIMAFLLATYTIPHDIEWTKLILAASVIGLLAAPMGFTISFIANMVTGENIVLTILGYAIDAAVTGSILSAIGFIGGSKVSLKTEPNITQKKSSQTR